MAPQGYDRYMLHNFAARHPKFAHMTVPERYCYFLGVLPIASMATVRGHLTVGPRRAREQDYADWCGVTVAVARKTVAKLREIGVILFDEDLDVEYIHDWEDINPQPKRDPTAADRQRAYRERLKRNRDERNERNGGVTLRSVTP